MKRTNNVIVSSKKFLYHDKQSRAPPPHFIPFFVHEYIKLKVCEVSFIVLETSGFPLISVSLKYPFHVDSTNSGTLHMYLC